ncbi:TPA: phage tail protein [Serratia marcescens]|uniref:phage tail protein n=1 Tax=Serratia TaxID=613 RepID=UPI001A2D93FF|nr:phage tail protein [Serratia marcescens]MDP8620004.1 phage tail protein [Serratia marcescens]HAT2907659.1 phage tail protein [Serratia marcescens]
MPQYISIITDVGANKIAAATANGEKINIAHAAVGDGLGTSPTPEPGQTELLGERYRTPINALRIDDRAPNQIIAEMTIPAAVGGFWCREAGVFDDTGALIAVCNLPPSYKPTSAEGSGRIQTIRIVIAVSSTAAIQLIIDPTVVMATVEYVNNQVRQAVQRANDAYELARQKVTFDEMYPIGEVKLFATFLNPNKQWPGTLWYYTGENKSIRIAKEDGSDVMGTGGADTATLSVENMPKHNHGVSGQVGEFDHGTRWASEFDHGTKWTSEGGEHAHQGGMVAPGEAWDGDYVVGSDNDSHRTRNWTSQNGKHSHTVDIGKHNHTVDIGKHSHSLELASAEVGGGQEFSIVESHIKLMCWYRAA